MLGFLQSISLFGASGNSALPDENGQVAPIVNLANHGYPPNLPTEPQRSVLLIPKASSNGKRFFILGKFDILGAKKGIVIPQNEEEDEPGTRVSFGDAKVYPTSVLQAELPDEDPNYFLVISGDYENQISGIVRDDGVFEQV